ncbi:hypothetical protein BHE74_00034071 [Ensete ventricosum]|nr:hypothetical protein BHE74_00034071 [Ensete ventricosum]
MGFELYAPASLFLLLSLPAFAYGWGVDGHAIICQIAQVGLFSLLSAASSCLLHFARMSCDRLSDSAAAAVEDLLPNYAKNNLSRLCSWADRVKFRYRWSSPLHYIDTPDGLCTYDYDREHQLFRLGSESDVSLRYMELSWLSTGDCKDEDGVKGRCVSGAITNYTNQLLDYGNSSSESHYNLTEALLFLAHLMGDVHQVWDDNIIETAEDRFYDDNVEEFTEAIKQNITVRCAMHGGDLVGENRREEAGGITSFLFEGCATIHETETPSIVNLQAQLQNKRNTHS